MINTTGLCGMFSSTVFGTDSPVAAWLGLIGDLVTVLAAILLVFDLVHEALQQKEVQKMTKVVEAQELQRIRIKVKGIVVRDHNGVQLAYVKQLSRRALLATVMLCLGFCFLLAERIIKFLAR